MDVIGTPDREPRRPLPRAVLLAGALVAAVVGGVVALASAPQPDVAPPARAVRAPQGPPDLGIRGIGGTSAPLGPGVQGTLDVEVRNGSRTVRLAGLTAEVPGVRFVPRTPPNGATLTQDGLIRLELGYVIEDCALLERSGRIVLTVLEPDGPLEVALPLLDDSGARRQSALDRVLDACPA